jgi:ribokinase
MYDVIVIGGTTRDFFLRSSAYRVEKGFLLLPWGEKVVAEELIKEVGGGGCNAAVAFSRLGLKTSLLSRVGEDASGELVLRRLRDEGVSLELMQIEEKGTTSTSFILLSVAGEHTLVMYRGHNDEVIGNDFSWESLASTSWLYLADVAAARNDPSLKVADFVGERHLKLAFIPGQHQLKMGLSLLVPILKRTTILILNVYEAESLLGEKVSLNAGGGNQLANLDKLLRQFYRLGVKTAVITADVHGVRAFDGQTFFFQKAPEVDKIIDTVGAGDAFAAGVVASLIRGRSLKEALVLGTENAGAVLQQVGAQPGLLRREL